MAKEESPLAIPQKVESHPAWYRLNDQLNWYNKRSGTSQRWYKTIKTTQLFLASAIPVVSFLVEIPWVRLATAVLGGTVALLEGVQQLGQFHNNWTSYRTTAEQLTHEKYLFLSSSGPYRNLETPDALKLLAERVEEQISTEHAKWVSDTKQTGGSQGEAKG
jgi:Protein of unknown function (DUF4231)